MNEQDKIKLILEIQRDPNLTDAEKAMKRQEVMTGKWLAQVVPEDKNDNGNDTAEDTAFADTLKCAICFDLCSRPITAPCQHNFCLKCFQDLVSKSKKKACPSCRHEFGSKFAENPRINTALAVAIRAFKAGDIPATKSAFTRIDNDDRPDEAFTTDRAQRAGMANAASGKIFVTTPPDHFGPIPASADPRGTGVKVGESWKDRLTCRQWGTHLPHVAGIAGQSRVGAQSVVLSGGYEDDRDEGEWFLYTGSGGRDLEGNKRTNKEQSFDQKFELMNLALKQSCIKGLPVRVVRSHKEKRSAYAPDTNVRYDGVYRIAACWRKKGAQGKLMCRFLFMRCDNEPAPWSEIDVKDKPWDIKKDLPREAIKEMEKAKEEVVYMEDSPWWDWNAEKDEWGWARPPPESQKIAGGSREVRARKKLSEQERALRELSCELCKNVLTQPMTAPCTHLFCKGCLDTHFGGQTFEYDASEVTGRSMRVRKIVITCPRKGCTADISDFLKRGQVNRDIEEVIAKLQKDVEAARAEGSKEDGSATEDDEEEGEGVTQEAPADTAGAASPALASLRRAPQTEAELSAAAAAELCDEFSEFDSELVHALVEQEDGDIQAVRICLTRMRNNEENEKKKRAKEARQASAAAAAISPAAANGSKRGRSKSATPSGSGAKKNVGRAGKRVKVNAS